MAEKAVKIVLLITGFLFCLGCVQSLYPVCRHNVVGDALFIGETYDVYQIAVDPTIAKHAQVRYFDNGWHWYGWVPKNFNPVLFFSVDEYLIWYRANYYNTRLTNDR